MGDLLASLIIGMGVTLLTAIAWPRVPLLTARVWRESERHPRPLRYFERKTWGSVFYVRFQLVGFVATVWLLSAFTVL
jgi:hypothetical protein